MSFIEDAERRIRESRQPRKTQYTVQEVKDYIADWILKHKKSVHNLRELESLTIQLLRGDGQIKEE